MSDFGDLMKIALGLGVGAEWSVFAENIAQRPLTIDEKYVYLRHIEQLAYKKSRILQAIRDF